MVWSVISTSLLVNKGPVSNCSSICIMVMPVLESPAIIARCIGAAPLQRGSIEACMFMQPRRGASRNAFGKIRPYATTIAASNLSSSKYCCSPSFFKLWGVLTVSPFNSAKQCTGEILSFFPLPAGRGGWV